MDKYRQLEKIGEGTYGIVYKAKNCFNGSIVALKKIRPEKETDSIPSTALREISVLRELSHPNVLKLHDILKNGENLYLVCEYLDCDLKKYLDFIPTDGLSKELTKSFMKQILEGIDYCHTRKILHRDLKPQNLLIDAKGNMKLADFGLAKATGIQLRTYTHDVVTLWYRSPEVLLSSSCYSSAIDMWSIGCIFAEMMKKKALFPGDSEIDQLFKIFMILGTPDEETWPGISGLPDYNKAFPIWKSKDLKIVFSDLSCQGLSLLQGLLSYDPTQRMSAGEALNEKYFHQTVKCLPNFFK